MRWEAWVLLALFVFSIAAETSDIGKPRKVLTREVATGVILCELIAERQLIDHGDDLELSTAVQNISRAAGVREGVRFVDELPFICALIRAGHGAGATVWAEIVAERHRAHLKHGATSMEACDRFADRRLRVLLEEVGEVATALNDREHDHAQPNRPQEWHDDVEDNAVADLRDELVQVASMAVAWIAALDDEALA